MVASTPSKRGAQAQERRNQLIDVARSLFAEKGMERTSIKEIAAAADVAQGLIYHYFRSKDELFWAIIQRDNPMPVMMDVYAHAEGMPVRDFLIYAARTAFATASERRDLIRIIIHETMAHPEMQQSLRGLQQMAIGMLSGYLTGRVAAGELRPHDTQVSARMLMGSVIAMLVTGLPPEPYIEQVVENLLHGIGAQ
ncbi:MAG TPA: TetR family transcriptional regulator [Ktedonobacterales bacterium]|nr:TetR family transcriptional regulator [Ktedonobacterales bacterium]